MTWADVVIIGGGAIGTSIGYHLLRLTQLRAVLVEKEPLLGAGSTGHCTGGIRHQFSTQVNVQMTALSLPHFARFEEELGVPIGFRQNGYLFLTASPGTREVLRQAVQLQNRLDVPTVLLDPAELATRFGYLRVDDLLGGSYCPIDGYADPHGLVQGYAQGFLRLGGQILLGERVCGIEVSSGRVRAVLTDKRRIGCGVAVNAAGPHAAEVARMAGVDVPVEPRPRQVTVLQPVPGIPADLPLTVDMDTGWYMHREPSGMLLLGGTDRDAPVGFDRSVKWHILERAVSAGVRRVPCLENGVVSKAYVGFRAMTPDSLALVGRTGEPEGLLVAGGFSGHGFMHAPGAGVLVAEMVAYGSARSLDISALSPERFRRARGPDRERATF